MGPHYKQSSAGACLPACARMVLAALGDERTEAELGKLLGTRYYGTPAHRIMRLEAWGYQVEYGPSSLDALRDHLAHGLWPIVFVDAEFLPWTDFRGFHALVVTEVVASEVAVLDPSLESGPSRLLIDGFLAAWGEFDFRAGVVRPSA